MKPHLDATFTMSVTKPLYFDNCTGFPSMSFASKPKIVVAGAGGAAFAIPAPHKIPTELSENPAYFTKCAAEHRPCPQTSSCLLINRSMNYFRSMTGTRVCCVTWTTLDIYNDVLLMRRARKIINPGLDIWEPSTEEETSDRPTTKYVLITVKYYWP